MKTRTKKFFKYCLILWLCPLAGCVSIGTHLAHNSDDTPVYKGTCRSIRTIFSKKEKDEPIAAYIGISAFCCLDLPPTIVADTLWLPFDLHDYHLQLEEANLLKGWTSKQFECDRQGNLTNHFQQVIFANCDGFMKQNNLSFMGGVISGFYEDGNGKYAVEFIAAKTGERDFWHYFLFYDKDGKIIQVKKYYGGHSSC